MGALNSVQGDKSDCGATPVEQELGASLLLCVCLSPLNDGRCRLKVLWSALPHVHICLIHPQGYNSRPNSNWNKRSQ
jgi:hypothetical protein